MRDRILALHSPICECSFKLAAQILVSSTAGIMVNFKPLQVLALGMVSLIAIACNVSTPNESTVAEGEAPITPVPPPLTEPSPSEAELAVYTEPTIPITTRYPVSVMEAESVATDEGISLEFTAIDNGPESAKMQFFLPADNTTPVEIEQAVTEPGGLFESNGWDVLEDSALVKRLNYPWMRTVIAFSGENDISGAIILGEVETQTVQLTVLYPDVYAEDYWTAATLILDYLEFKPELLPVE